MALAGRVLTILDSGMFGPARLTKSITITATGVSADIRGAADGDAITIDGSSANVVLRGLSLTGISGSSTGIHVIRALAVTVEDCAIERFSGDGILFDNTNFARVFISETVSRSNGGAGLRTTGGQRLAVEDSRFENNGGNGVHQTGGTGNYTRATAAGNGNHGFFIEQGTMTLESSIGRDNKGSVGAGVFINLAGSTAILSNSVFTNNNYGIFNNNTGGSNGGTVLTRGNNTAADNASGQVFGSVLTTLNGV